MSRVPSHPAMPALSYSKKQLRHDYRKILENLDNRWVRAASHRLAKELTAFFELPAQHGIENLLGFSSFFPGEVDLTPFFSQVISKKNVFLPRCKADASMTFVSVGREWSSQDGTPLVRPGLFGILEPTDEIEDAGEIFDSSLQEKSAILIPGLAFDHQGNRLGRGKGYYDRFLSNRRHQDILKIGVGWDLQLLDGGVPTDPHDVVLQWFISEERTQFVGDSFSSDED